MSRHKRNTSGRKSTKTAIDPRQQSNRKTSSGRRPRRPKDARQSQNKPSETRRAAKSNAEGRSQSTTRHRSAAPRAGKRTQRESRLRMPKLGPRHACNLIGLLSGMGACLLLVGVIHRCSAMPNLRIGSLVVVVAGLCCLIAGPLLSARLAAFLDWRRRDELFPPASAGDEARLLWTVLAVLSLVSGLVTAAMPVAVPTMAAGYDRLATEFLWPANFLPVVQLAILFLMLLPILGPAGLGLSCACRLACRGEGWKVSPIGWGLIGLGLGGGIADRLAQAGASPDALLLSAAVPSLLTAVVAVWRNQDPAGQPAGGPASAVAPAWLPQVSDRDPILVRVSAGWLAACLAAMVAIWPALCRHCPAADTSAGTKLWPVLLLAAGVGLLISERSRSVRVHSAGGVGVAAAVAGLGVAGAAALPAAWLSAAPQAGMGMAVAAATGGIATLLIGYALGYAYLAVLCRTGRRVATGVVLLCVSLAAAVLVLPPTSASTGTAKAAFAMLAGVALSLVALGGTMIIHQPTGSVRTRRLRLAAVFASIALLIQLLPPAGRVWSRSIAAAPTTDSPTSKSL